MYDEILVPTDGSESAERAVQYGVVLATAFDARVHVLSVVDERDYDSTVVGGEAAMQQGVDAAKTAAEEAVTSVAERVAADVTTQVTVGVPSETILDYVETAGIDLVTMATHGRTGVKRFIIGSVTEKVVRRATVPVLTVRVSDRLPSWPPLDRVLVPTDGSDASLSALPNAFAVAERFDATVEGLYVVDERTKSTFYNVGTALEDVVGGLEAAAKEATERIETTARERGIEASSAVVEGLPSEAICTYADESDADIVVMASHGRTGLSHYLLGSVAERVVRNATVPVLITPARDFDD